MEISFMRKMYTIYLQEASYAVNRRLAIQAIAFCNESGRWEPFGWVTTNLTEGNLRDGEFFVKTYSEGVWVKQLLAAGVFEDTGRTWPSGYVDIPIWRRGPNYAAACERPSDPERTNPVDSGSGEEEWDSSSDTL